MRTLITLIVFAAIGFSGCDSCYNVECDAPDVDYINGLHFEFDKQSFDFDEIEHGYVLQFNPGDLKQPVDTLDLFGLINDSDRVFYIGSNVFSKAVDFADFDYGIYNNSGEYAYLISNIVTNGHYPTDCCCCYRNKEKTFILNGKKQDRSGSIEPFLLVK